MNESGLSRTSEDPGNGPATDEDATAGAPRASAGREYTVLPTIPAATAAPVITTTAGTSQRLATLPTRAA
ncbi:hypothetical protein SK571_12165 [Lentzea sp. BCCO 10_0798]|uniref:Uncharacterized protein n=1 Tax=Lentzea kristufekii TaxID=3095430 RepID=A0ABU4TPD7_9PSEU|nr:hypothetical protein [Lentzea sp. BCCO 10_0798]MDX8050136.1 hypothetical protein [Lentzea sp. BCCO 10_0798]